MGTPLIDIPTGWDPQAKQSRTVALLAALCAALFEVPSLAQKEKPAHNVYWFLVRGRGLERQENDGLTFAFDVLLRILTSLCTCSKSPGGCAFAGLPGVVVRPFHGMHNIEAGRRLGAAAPCSLLSLCLQLVVGLICLNGGSGETVVVPPAHRRGHRADAVRPIPCHPSELLHTPGALPACQ